MVQQILGKRDIGGQLGQALGGGIQKGFENQYEYGRDLERSRSDEQFQYERNRSRLQQAFGELESLAGDEKAAENPYKLLSKLGQAFAGIPGGQQVVSEVFPALIQKAQRDNATSQASNPFASGGTNPLASGKPQGTPIKGQQDQYFSDGGSNGQDTMYNDSKAPLVRNVPVSKDGVQNLNNFAGQRDDKMSPQAQNDLNQRRLGRSPLVPTQFGEGPVPQTLGASSYLNELNAADQLGNPQLAENRKKNIREAQQQAQADFTQQENAQQIRQADLDALVSRQDRFRNFASTRLPKDTDPTDLSTFMEIGSQYMDSDNEDQWYLKTKRDFDTFDKIRENIFTSQRPWNEQAINASMRTLKNSVKPLIAMGLHGKAVQLLDAAGWGQGQIDFITNPFDDKFKNGIEKLPRLPLLNQLNPKNIKNVNDTQQKYVDYIIKNWKTGSADKPGTGIFGLRSLLQDKEINWSQFQDILNDAIEKGGLKLDPYQQMQYGQIAQPPQAGLIETLFGGKR